MPDTFRRIEGDASAPEPFQPSDHWRRVSVNLNPPPKHVIRERRAIQAIFYTAALTGCFAFALYFWMGIF